VESGVRAGHVTTARETINTDKILMWKSSGKFEAEDGNNTRFRKREFLEEKVHEID